MHSRNLTTVLIAAAGTMLLAACHQGQTVPAVTIATSAQDSSEKKISTLISNIPFPGDIMDTLGSIHARYESQLTNPAASADLYNDANSQAINLGAFGADLAYVISFEHFQDVGPYIKGAKKLADQIGIPIDYTEQLIVRCQNNRNNKDSLRRIVYQGYTVINQTLRQNRRTAAEVLVLAGGWIEGAYLTTQSLHTVTDSTEKLKLFKVIYRQKFYADNLLALLGQVSSSPYCQQLISKLQEVRNGYEQIQPAAPNPEVLSSLTDKIKDLRSLIIKGNS